MTQDYSNRCDKTIQIDVIGLNKWMWQDYTNGNDKTIKFNMTKLCKWIRKICRKGYEKATNGCEYNEFINGWWD